MKKITKKSGWFTWAGTIAALWLPGCSTLPWNNASKNEPTILTGRWQGELSVPEQFSSNRGLLDSPCDKETDGMGNVKLEITQDESTVKVIGKLRCSLEGKSVYSADIPPYVLELKGQDLLQEGKKIGTATPTFFSLNTAQGTLMVIRYPTWEKIYFEAKSGIDSSNSLSGVFENTASPKNQPDKAPKDREPANTSRLP